MGLRALIADDAARMGVSKRVGACGVVPLGADGILVRELAAPGDCPAGTPPNTSYFAGLSTCGLAHQDPVCSSKIRAAYAVKVAEEVEACRGMGGAVHHLTLTLPHDRHDPLPRTLRGLDSGWSKIKEGGTWTRVCKRIGYIGTERAEEYTWSCGNGHHPHLHVLIFTDHELVAEEFVVLDQHVRSKWIAGVTSKGIRPPVGDIGVKLQFNIGGTDIARYVTKVQEGDWGIAQEVTRTDVKTGRGEHMTPFEVADAFFETGDIEYAAAFSEYVRASKGRSVIRASRGLRAKLGLGAFKLTDEEIAAAEVEAPKRTVAVLPLPVWSRVRLARLEHDVLLACERGGLDAINELLGVHGCGWALPPPDEGSPG
jgi:hypothetical protein